MSAAPKRNQGFVLPKHNTIVLVLKLIACFAKLSSAECLRFWTEFPSKSGTRKQESDSDLSDITTQDSTAEFSFSCSKVAAHCWCLDVSRGGRQGRADWWGGGALRRRPGGQPGDAFRSPSRGTSVEIRPHGGALVAPVTERLTAA